MLTEILKCYNWKGTFQYYIRRLNMLQVLIIYKIIYTLNGSQIIFLAMR